MKAFRGMAEVRVDDRNRVPVPARFMELLRGLDEYANATEAIEVIVGLDRTGKVGIFPKSVYEDFLTYLENQDPHDPNWDQIRESIFGNSHECQLDSQNRVKLPAPLCNLFGLSGEVIVRGVGDHLQVLNRDDWKEGTLAVPEKYRALYAARGDMKG